MKKIIGVLIVILIFTMSGCTQKEKTLTIGFAGTLSGSYSAVGTQALYGVQMAIDEINESGGINGMQVELEIKDDEADPIRAVEVDNELLDMGINIIIGHNLSIVALETVENLAGKNALFLSPSIGTDALSNLDDNLIRNVSTTYYEGKQITESILEDNPNKILLLYNLDNYVLTQHHKNSFEEILLEHDFTTDDYETYGFESDNITHYDIMESKLSSGEFDSVMFVGSNVDAAPIVNYIKANDLTIPIHLTSWASTGLIDRITTDDTSGIFAYFDFHVPDTEEFIHFKETYEETYELDVHMLSVNGYDLVYLLKQVIENANSTDPTTIKETILTIGVFDGITGPYSINEFGDCQKEHIKMIISKGEYTPFEE